MAKISDSLRLLFETSIEEDGDRYVVEIPDALVDGESVSVDEQYRIALLAAEQADADTDADVESAATPTTSAAQSRTQTQSQSSGTDTRQHQEPPVEEGEVREVTIDTLGNQGDGIAKVERGFVVIVSDAEPGEQLDVEITDVKDTVAFAEPLAQ